MDSVTLAHYLRSKNHELTLISFNYGQRHTKELAFADMCATRLNVPIHTVDVGSLQSVLSGSSLTTHTIDVPDGHYAEESMKATVVPNRNAIMISIAAGLAVSIDAEAVAVGVHGGDHFIYPDCRPEFIESIENSVKIANEGFLSSGFKILAPFLHKTKTDIAKLGNELEVPWTDTWSCYKGLDKHCGLCGTCVERKEAFSEAKLNDPTEYTSPPTAPV